MAPAIPARSANPSLPEAELRMGEGGSEGAKAGPYRRFEIGGVEGGWEGEFWMFDFGWRGKDEDEVKIRSRGRALPSGKSQDSTRRSGKSFFHFRGG
ncbi:MAG: hypothetical protein EBS53_05000 [Bacteroidetes bacterium]|nr:hypothetical protein [Bacteroidota bacterium]